MVRSPLAEISSRRRKFNALYPKLALLLSSVLFAQIYCTLRAPYIDLLRYTQGHERLPFQARDLMRWPMLAATHSSFLQRATAGRTVLRSPQFLVMEVFAAVSLLLAGWAAMKLYRLALPDAPAPELAFAVLTVICYFDFVLVVPFSFPYDLPSVAFLGWGAYFVLSERFRWLLPVFLAGTWNRETMLFLVPVLLLVAATRSGSLRWSDIRSRDWMRASILLAIWVGLFVFKQHLYAANPSEVGPRILGNLRFLRNPMLWPTIFGASAFLLPYVYFNRHRIAFAPLRASLLILPFWIALLLSAGQILEIRIYGDISVLVAVAASVILVQTVRDGTRREGGSTPSTASR